MVKKFFLCFLCLFFLMGCENKKPEPNNQTQETSGRLIEIDYDTLMAKIEQDEKMILYIGRPDCLDCKEFVPVIEKGLSLDENLVIYYFNTKAMRDEAKKEDAPKEKKEFYEKMRSQLSFTWTPTVQKRQGATILSSYTYLETGYYDLEDNNEKKEAKVKAQEAFIEWLRK